MADKELHPVVKLLLKRMESHPEEFERGVNRWGWMVEAVLESCSEEERNAIKAGLRPIRLQVIHKDVMEELLSGDERRRKEAEEHEYERNLMQQHQLKMQQQQQQMVNAGLSLNAARHPTIDDMKNNGILNAIRNIL